MTTKSEITRTGFALMMCVALVVVLCIFNVVFFVRIGLLQLNYSGLKSDYDSLSTSYNDYKTTHSH